MVTLFSRKPVVLFDLYNEIAVFDPLSGLRIGGISGISGPLVGAEPSTSVFWATEANSLQKVRLFVP